MTTEYTITQQGSWSTFISEGRRDLIQGDIDRAIHSYSESAGAPRYAAVNSRYRDTVVQDYLVSQQIVPRFANSVGTWEIWLSTRTLVLNGEGKDLLAPLRDYDLTEEERGRFYMWTEDGLPAEVGSVRASRKKGTGRGRTKIMHNGISREDWIQAEFRKGRTRREIADELGVRYQIVFAATKGMTV